MRRLFNRNCTIALLLIFCPLNRILFSIDSDLTFRTIQETHIKANVPDEGDFNLFLQRDLHRYCTRRFGLKRQAKIEYAFLRNRATQSGVGYPKYYIWVRISDTKNPISGAARIAAIDKKELEITDFITLPKIKKDPSILDKIFPEAVKIKIQANFL